MSENFKDAISTIQKESKMTIEQRLNRLEEKVSQKKPLKEGRFGKDEKFLRDFESKVKKVFELGTTYGKDISTLLSYPALEQEMREIIRDGWNKYCDRSNEL